MSNKKELNKVDINVQFEESPTRINITSGEGIKTLFGKIRKYFSDLHSVAFSGSYEDLENKPTIPEIPDISTKMDKDNPVGTGSLSIDRKSSTTIGKNSVALGKDCIAAGDYSLSMGYQNTVNAHYASAEGESNTIGTYGYCSHVEGWSNTVTGRNSHAEGYGNKATNSYTHAEGNQVIASGESAHAEGYETTASGEAAHVEGRYSKAQKISAHAEGCFTIADSPDQHTEGRYNKIDSESIYAHIVGNGTNNSNRSNAYTLDWDGNGVYSGKVSVGANVTPTEDNDLVTKKYVDDNSTIKAVDCTRAEYDAMEYHDPDTYYNIIDGDNGLATHEADGLMSKEDKIKLDGMSGGGGVTFGEATTLFEGTVNIESKSSGIIINLNQNITDFDVIFVKIEDTTLCITSSNIYTLYFSAPIICFPKIPIFPTQYKVGTSTSSEYGAVAIPSTVTFNTNNIYVKFPVTCVYGISGSGGKTACGKITVIGFNITENQG